MRHSLDLFNSAFRALLFRHSCQAQKRRRGPEQSLSAPNSKTLKPELPMTTVGLTNANDRTMDAEAKKKLQNELDEAARKVSAVRRKAFHADHEKSTKGRGRGRGGKGKGKSKGGTKGKDKGGKGSKSKKVPRSTKAGTGKGSKKEDEREEDGDMEEEGDSLDSEEELSEEETDEYEEGEEE